MNKEQQQIIDEVYQNYLTNFIPPTCPPNLDVQPSYYEPMSKEWFIKSIKERGLRGEEFSNKCGLKIEERELSLEERGEWDSKRDNVRNTWGQTIQTFTPNEVRTWLNEKNVPTKLITIKYKNETITSYE